MVIGIDIGGTTTKLVGYRNGSLTGPVSVTANDPVASASGALGKFLTEQGAALGDIRRLCVTGVGAGRLGNSLFGLPVHQVREFTAIGLGGSRLAGCRRAIVVSMGTGTALVKVDDTEIVHWGGTGVGGGTLVGLSKLILGITDVREAARRAAEGDLSRVDLTVGDIACCDDVGLGDTITASNFGKCADTAAGPDLAMAIFNLVFQTAGVVAHGASEATGIREIIITGRLATIPLAKGIFDGLAGLYGITFIIPPSAEYATALGAALAVPDNAGEAL